MALLRNEQMQLWRSRMNNLRRHDGLLKHPQRGSPVMSCHVWYIPFLISVWLTTMSFLLVTAVWLYDFNHAGLVIWHYGAVVCMLLPIRKLFEVAQDACFDHIQSHHQTSHNCSLCIEKGLVISAIDHPVFDAAVDMSMSTLFLLKETAKCARYFLPLLLILLSGDIELNPGPECPSVSPQNLALAASCYTVTATWDPIPPNRHGTITHYVAKITDESGKVLHESNQSLEGLSFVSLVPGRTYTVYVAGANEIGCGPFADKTITTETTSPSSSPTFSKPILDESDFALVVSFLKYLDHREVSKVGVSLGLNPRILAGTRSMNIHNIVAKRWLEMLDHVESKSGKPTWRTLVKALRKNGYNVVASAIEVKFSYTADDESRKLSTRIDEVSRDFGSAKHFLANLVFVGLPGSGKTTLIANLTGKLKEEIKKLMDASPSTDVMDKVLHVDIQKASVIDDKWATFESSEYGVLMEIVRFIQNHSSEAKNTETVSIQSDDFNLQNDGPQEVEDGHEEVLDSGVVGKTWITKEQHEKLLPRFNNQYSLNIFDTGGQLELQDLLPLFVTGPLIFIFVFPLSTKGLDYCTKTSYRDMVDGAIQHVNSYSCSHTVKDLLSQTLSSVRSLKLAMPSSKTEEECIPHIFLVGTHRDQLVREFFEQIIRERLEKKAGLIDETKLKIKHERRVTIDIDGVENRYEIEQEEINKKVNDFLKKLNSEVKLITSKYNVGTVEDEGESTSYFFQVDNAEECKDEGVDLALVEYGERKFVYYVTTDQTKSGVFRKIRSRVKSWIADNEAQFTVKKYPLNYLLASKCLSDKSEYIFYKKDDFADDLKKEGIKLSKTEDIEDGKNVAMEDFLDFMHSVTGQIRYYPEVPEMENIIINQPQVLYKLITYLIINKKKLRNETERAKFKKGIFTYGHFREGMEFKMKDQEKIFTPEMLLGILVNRGIVTFLHDDETLDDNVLLFMPCKLNQAEKFKEETETDLCYSPLAIKFSCGHCPKGLFGVLVHFLMEGNPDSESIAHRGWILDEQSIFRDRVSFDINKQCDSITLIFSPSHLLVKVFPSTTTEAANVLKKYCSEVKKKLKLALTKALKHLQYDVQHEFVCVYKCCWKTLKLDSSPIGKDNFRICCKRAELNEDAEIWMEIGAPVDEFCEKKFSEFLNNNPGGILAVTLDLEEEHLLALKNKITVIDKDAVIASKEETCKTSSRWPYGSKKVELTNETTKPADRPIKKQRSDDTTTATTTEIGTEETLSGNFGLAYKGTGTSIGVSETTKLTVAYSKTDHCGTLQEEIFNVLVKPGHKVKARIKEEVITKRCAVKQVKLNFPRKTKFIVSKRNILRLKFRSTTMKLIEKFEEEDIEKDNGLTDNVTVKVQGLYTWEDSTYVRDVGPQIPIALPWNETP